MSKSVVNDTDQLDCCQRLCRGRCCRYITIQIPAPRLKADFDEISWFLAHDDISVYFNARRWHVEFRSRCKHLTEQNLCAIYETRPVVCRGYDADECEYPERPKHDLQFNTQDEFEAWWASKREQVREARRQRGRAAARS
jgi:Fe-S-cluster containining protein